MADFAREKNELLARELKAGKAEVFPVYFSAEDLESCRSLIEQTLDKYGRIDVLVNNVGGTDLQRDTDIGTLDITFFDRAFHLNLRSAICLSQLAIPAMLRQKGEISSTSPPSEDSPEISEALTTAHPKRHLST